MNGQIKFYNKTNGDRELVSLILDSLMQIKLYYTSRKEKVKTLEYNEGEEIDLMNVLISSSELWISKIIFLFEDLKENYINQASIDKNDLELIKYLVDFWWHNVPTAKETYEHKVYLNFNMLFLQKKSSSFGKLKLV